MTDHRLRGDAVPGARHWTRFVDETGEQLRGMACTMLMHPAAQRAVRNDDEPKPAAATRRANDGGGLRDVLLVGYLEPGRRYDL